MWSSLIERTDGLRGPCLFSPPFSVPITFVEVAAILRGARDAPGSVKLNYFRGYIEGREDYDIASKFLCDESLRSEDIEYSISQAFDPEHGSYGCRAGLVVNGGLQWSNEVHERLAPHAEALCASACGAATLDLTLFIGGYGATPFGAHIDDAAHRTVIFNLGPNPKDVSIWPRKAVEAQFGPVRNISDPNTILVTPERFSIPCGKAFVLPSDEFHIAYNNEVSTAATLVLDHVPDSRLAERELGFHRHDLDHQMIGINFQQLTISKLIKMSRMRVQSNGGLRYPPPPHPDPVDGLTKKSLLRVDTRWPILVEKVDVHEIVYARGRHLQTRWLSGALNKLLLAGMTTVGDILEIAIQDGSDLASGLRLIHFLLESRGVVRT